MAFNINEFKSKVFGQKYNGFSRPNLFMMNISKDNNEGVGQDLSFFCNAITFPGINLNTIEYRPDSNGLGQMIPTGIQYSSINAVIMLDDNHKILSFFHRWMQSIYNYNSIDGKNKPREGDSRHMPHELGYKKEYSCEMEIRFFSAGNASSFYSAKLTGVYPYEISPVELSWSNDSQISFVTVQFSYGAIKMQGAASGQVPNYYIVDGTEITVDNALRDSQLLRQQVNTFAENTNTFGF